MLPAGQAAQLTWYPGSIRPYASLWHTILRVTALNCLRSGEVPAWPTALSATGRTQRSLYPMHNAAAAIDTAALAIALGESPSVFRWSHFGALAPWLSFLVTPGFRICLSCLAQGYHSALFSLRLFDNCPLHHQPLLAHCRCGRMFKATISVADFKRAGNCMCYQQPYFTPESCRCPTLDPSLAGVFDPVVHWLEQLSQVIRPTQTRSLINDEIPARLSLLSEWSEALGLDYPASFMRPKSVARHMFHIRTSGNFQGIKLREPCVVTSRQASSLWKNTPSTWTYRAMSRYMRRHLSRGAEYWALELMGSPDPIATAQLLRSDRRAECAYAEMLWANNIEPHVHERRWPYRYPHSAQWPKRWIGAFVPTKTSLGAAQCWLEYHTAGASMLALWRAACAQASTVAQTGTDERESTRKILSCPCDWSAVQKADGTLHFLCLSTGTFRFSAPSRPDKRARSEGIRKAREATRQAILDACTGPCLTWTEREGWYVTASASPTNNGCRRQRLLGFKENKPLFWIFQDDNQFVARLCRTKLQAFGTTARDAIGALRCSLRQYARLYGSVSPGSI